MARGILFLILADDRLIVAAIDDQFKPGSLLYVLKSEIQIA